MNIDTAQCPSCNSQSLILTEEDDRFMLYYHRCEYTKRTDIHVHRAQVASVAKVLRMLRERAA